MVNTRRQFVMGACLAALTFVSLPVSAAPIVLNFSEVSPDTNFLVQDIKRFANAVSKETNGEVTIKVFAGGALGFKGPEQMKVVQSGQVAMADIVASQQVAEEPLMGIEGVPFLVASQSNLKTLHKLVRPALEDITSQKHNQKILFMVPSPSQYMFLKVQTNKLDGFNKIKIRGADKSTVDICNTLGMNGVMIPLSELFAALATDIVDGVATSATTAVDVEFWKKLKYIYRTNHTWSSNMITINLDVWKKIPAQHQKTIETLAAKMEPEFWESSTKADAESLKKLTANGMEMVQIPPAMMADIQQRTKPLIEAYQKRVPAADPIIKKYLAAVGR